MVIRNAGGRVSPDVLTDLAYIGYLSSTVASGGPRFEVAVIHHTQCGTHFLADADFERLRSSAILPPTITVSGHVYDVDTGLITTVIPAAPMHTSG